MVRGTKSKIAKIGRVLTEMLLTSCCGGDAATSLALSQIVALLAMQQAILLWSF